MKQVTYLCDACKKEAVVSVDIPCGYYSDPCEGMKRNYQRFDICDGHAATLLKLYAEDLFEQNYIILKRAGLNPKMTAV